MSKRANIHREEFTVRAYEIDAKGKASVPTICNYLQEAAGNHATKLGAAVDRLFPLGMTWVLSRLHLQFSGFPHWREQIVVETWPSGRQGKFATRDFYIFDHENHVLVKATSSWMILDLKSLRPINLPDFILEIELPDREHAMVDDFKKLPAPSSANIERQFDVRLHDLDINQHVNNVTYIEWALETIPPDIWKAKMIRELEITFRSETKYGEGVFIQTEQQEDRFLHRIISENDGRDLAILVTHWQDK
jgi:acyl-ACP thioesterase